MFQTQVLWTFPPARVSVPSGLLLAAAKLLKPLASLQLPAPYAVRGEVAVWEQVFSLPRSH